MIFDHSDSGVLKSTELISKYTMDIGLKINIIFNFSNSISLYYFIFHQKKLLASEHYLGLVKLYFDQPGWLVRKMVKHRPWGCYIVLMYVMSPPCIIVFVCVCDLLGEHSIPDTRFFLKFITLMLYILSTQVIGLLCCYLLSILTGYLCLP